MTRKFVDRCNISNLHRFEFEYKESSPNTFFSYFVIKFSAKNFVKIKANGGKKWNSLTRVYTARVCLCHPSTFMSLFNAVWRSLFWLSVIVEIGVTLWWDLMRWSSAQKHAIFSVISVYKHFITQFVASCHHLNQVKWKRKKKNTFIVWIEKKFKRRSLFFYLLRLFFQYFYKIHRFRNDKTSSIPVKRVKAFVSFWIHRQVVSFFREKKNRHIFMIGRLLNKRNKKKAAKGMLSFQRISRVFEQSLKLSPKHILTNSNVFVSYLNAL